MSICSVADRLSLNTDLKRLHDVMRPYSYRKSPPYLGHDTAFVSPLLIYSFSDTIVNILSVNLCLFIASVLLIIPANTLVTPVSFIEDMQN